MVERRSGGRLRDRRGRGPRGPWFLPGPLAPEGVPARRTGAERFDDLALDVMEDVTERWPDRLGDVELAVEEIPLLPRDWNERTVPLASYVEGTGATPPRLVLFRRPIEHRAPTRLELDSLLLTVVVEQLAEVLGLPPEDVHPGYEVD